MIQLSVCSMSFDFDDVPLNSPQISQINSNHPKFSFYPPNNSNNYGTVSNRCISNPPPNTKIGQYLEQLKNNKDYNYRIFLHPYGDLDYCKFGINQNNSYFSNQGLYFFYIEKNGETEDNRETSNVDIYYEIDQNNSIEIKYLGKTTAGFGKRVNQGYGNISARNCYIGGQITNCRINNLILQEKIKGNDVKFAVCTKVQNLNDAEKWLIAKYRFPWNIR